MGEGELKKQKTKRKMKKKTKMNLDSRRYKFNFSTPCRWGVEKLRRRWCRKWRKLCWFLWPSEKTSLPRLCSWGADSQFSAAPSAPPGSAVTHETLLTARCCQPAQTHTRRRRVMLVGLFSYTDWSCIVSRVAKMVSFCAFYHAGYLHQKPLPTLLSYSYVVMFWWICSLNIGIYYSVSWIMNLLSY